MSIVVNTDNPVEELDLSTALNTLDVPTGDVVGVPAVLDAKRPIEGEIIRPVRFDYSKFDKAIAKDGENAANRIRKHLENGKSLTFEIGRELLKIKGKLGHGGFGQWISAEFDMTARSAQNFMSAAAAVTKYETLSVLPDTALYKLGAKDTKDSVRGAVADEIKNGRTPSIQEIVDMISQQSPKAAKPKAPSRPVSQVDLGNLRSENQNLRKQVDELEEKNEIQALNIEELTKEVEVYRAAIERHKAKRAAQTIEHQSLKEAA